MAKKFLGANVMSEEILGIFPGLIPKGFMKVWNCMLVFTTTRLVLAKDKRPYFSSILLDPYYIASVANARERLKMRERSAEDILKADAENFEIPYSDITALEITGGRRFETPGPHLEVYIGDLDTPKYRFRVCLKEKYFSSFEEFLREILPEKV
jgi:hypothetical protein